MKTLLNSVSNHSNRGNRITATLIIISLLSTSLMASADKKMDGFIPHMLKGWTICWEGNEIRPGSADDIESVLTLACKPEVNVSLGQQGYAAITSLLLVNAPAYPANQYDIDIMGPLSDTVYCEQLGQELMVLVTEIPTGNSCMSTIFIEDKLRPVLVCTSDTLPCNVDISSIDFESFIDSVTDNCDPDPDLWYSYTIQNLPCNANGFTQSILVTWTATDASGNSATCQDVIYLKKPALGQIVFPPNISVSCTNPNIDPSITGEPTFNGEPIGLTCQIVVSYTDQVVPMCNGSRKVLRMWTIMDWCTSGMVNHVQEILIIDNVPPVIICPPSTTINTDPGLCTVKYTLPLPNVTDACSNPNMIVIEIFLSGIPGVYVPGNMVTLGLGTTLVTIRARDACMNSSQCQYNVTVRDNTPPVIICPANTNVDCNGSTDPSVTGSATAFDICDPTPTLTYNDVTVAFPGCAVGYKINRTWKAQDDSGNTACCTQMITLTDATPPVITCPPNVAITCTASTLPANTGSATATDHCDTSPIVTFSDASVGGACPQERTISRTWRATDDCGNSSSCVQTISVEDNLAPVITCPPNVSVECESMTIPGFTGSATATDNCDPTPTITFTDISTPSGPQEFTITRTWNASDDCGNSSTCIQLIIVHDETPPVITCPSNITIQCTASTLPGNTGSATATDNCDPVPDITFSDVTVGGICPQERTITRTWVATDDCGNSSTCNQSIFVDDSVPPVITCPANIAIQCTASTLPGNTGTATATDNCDAIPNVTFSDVTVGGICPQERTITRTWNAIDDCGNSSTCVQTIIVDDSVAPVITCPSNITIQCTASTLPGNTGTATATDNCDAIPDVTFSDVTVAGACVQERTISRTWSATDDCGNNSTCLQTIFVDDSVPPVITCPADVTVDCTDSTLPANTGTATATDNCNATPVVTFSDVTVGGSCPILVTITRTWTASDGCSNTSTCVQLIVVTDNDGPSITCPPNLTIECDESTLPANTGVPTTTDNCGIGAPPATFTDVTVGGACPQERTITRTWVATDGCNNSSTCVQTIFVDDSTAPAITCPINVTIECDDSTLPGSTGSATATDNCDATPSVTFSDETEGAGCPDGLTITRTWVAVDDCGNSGSCVQTILVNDNTAPAITCPINVTIECTDSTDPDDTGTATATDICDATPTITFTDVTVGSACPQLYTITRTWIATDDCGNAGTCNQTIVLDDTTDPLCAAMDITVSLNGSGFVTILPSQVDDGSSDNCGPVDLSVEPDEFNCDSVGENLVVLTVTDCSGNSSTCTAIVTVEDSEGLQAICQNVSIILDENGNATIDPSQIDNGSGGGCAGGDLEFMLSQTDFDCADVGQVIVTLTVTDAMGNEATCTAIITVIDAQDPTIMCPADVTVSCQTLTDPENTGQFGNATASDNCPGVIITETHVIDLNDCNVGTITRTFFAQDASDNIAICQQIVTVNNPNPMDEDDITWPPSPISVDICNSTLPQNLPNGFPVIDASALLCSDPIISFVDVVQTIIDNNPATPCKIITRTWTVIDNCQVNGTFVFVQTINVQDMVAPVFTNINNMTKVANALCVANFTLIASATDCAGVSITNDSPYGANGGSNASGDYPVGVTTVIFTATDGCGNISTMDVVITVTDPNPTDFQCEKTIVFLPEETEVTLSARIFVTFMDGGCSDPNDYIVSFTRSDPFDTTNVYDCGDVGVSTFSLWFFTADGTQLVDSCFTADLDLRDPTDLCQDGLVLIGNIEGEEGQAVSGVEVSITNVPMTPDTTNIQGQYSLAGLNKGTGYMVVPFNDLNHREGVSTLDLVLIQKHLLGRAKLNSPYKMIAADANKSGNITALDLIEIRRLILGINSRFPNNTSWRFIEQAYSFIDPFNPFGHPIPESVWLDSISHDINTVNFVGVKIGDVNGSYFLSQATNGKIEPRFLDQYELEMGVYSNPENNGSRIEISVPAGQGEIDGFQFGLFVGDLTSEQINGIHSDYLLPEEWVYNSQTGILNVSRAMAMAEDISGKIILTIPDVAITKNNFKIESSTITPEVYIVEDEIIEVKRIHLKSVEKIEALANEYHLYQNIPNPFVDGTVISFFLPQQETVKLVIYDNTGKQVFEVSSKMEAGHNEIPIKSTSLRHAGIYYYTLYTANASFTRKMSFTND